MKGGRGGFERGEGGGSVAAGTGRSDRGLTPTGTRRKGPPPGGGEQRRHR